MNTRQAWLTAMTGADDTLSARYGIPEAAPAPVSPSAVTVTERPQPAPAIVSVSRRQPGRLSRMLGARPCVTLTIAVPVSVSAPEAEISAAIARMAEAANPRGWALAGGAQIQTQR